MAILAVIIGLIGLVLFIAYWTVMLMLLIIWVVFMVWAALFTYILGDPYTGGVCAVFATAITFWLHGIYGDKNN